MGMMLIILIIFILQRKYSTFGKAHHVDVFLQLNGRDISTCYILVLFYIASLLKLAICARMERYMFTFSTLGLLSFPPLEWNVHIGLSFN